MEVVMDNMDQVIISCLYMIDNNIPIKVSVDVCRDIDCECGNSFRSYGHDGSFYLTAISKNKLRIESSYDVYPQYSLDRLKRMI